MTASPPSSDSGDVAEVRPPALQLSNLTKQFVDAGSQKITAVDSLDLVVGQGQMVGIVGSNGAGKSTLLSIIAGSTLPDAGRILISGDDVTLTPSWMRASLVRRVRQNPFDNVLATLTIEENFALALRGVRSFRLRPALRTSIREQAVESLRPFGMGLENRLRTLSEQLSGGQRQALAVAMAAATRPAVLLLDEHVAALDPSSGQAVMEETERIIKAHHITTLMVTHDMSRALVHSDRLLMMHRGRIVLDLTGALKEQLTPSDLVTLFEARSGEAVPDRSLLA
jgi:putative ABC transport system ATP-binding protein